MKQVKKPLLILTGPTAVGKTKLSISLAKAVDGEIVSADSMQVYRYMDIGSAKIKPSEMCGIPHYLVDMMDPSVDFNVVLFQTMAKQAIQEIYAKGKIPILTGGTGFYIQAVVNDIDFTDNEEDTKYRLELEQLADRLGPDVLHRQLEKIDPDSAKEIHENNVKRVIRALEYYHQTGEPISIHNRRERQKDSPYNFVYFVLNDIRDQLYEAIDRRVDTMLEEGLLEEVKFLAQKGYHKNMVSMQGLGYKEMLSYLDGTYSYEEAVTILKRDTRHFAKRQLTWFRREKEVTWINKEAYQHKEDKILDYMLQVCRERGIL